MTGTLVVGAGPAGLACALALTCHGYGDEVEVVDPAGRWLAAWDHRFAAQDIPHLRSPSVHHPHPDPFELLRFAEGAGLVPSGGTQLPTTELFRRFVDDTVTRSGLASTVTAASVTTLEVTAAGGARVRLDDGSERRPDRLILATNTRRPVLPSAFVGAMSWPQVLLGDDAAVDATPPGGRVVVVGGGLSAAHLAVGAARRGAQVVLLARRRLTVRRFDTHPSWLGPKKRRPFEREPDPAVRRRAIDTARGGGSVPHRIRRELEEHQAAGRLLLAERVTPVAVDTVGEHIQVTGDDGSSFAADTVWLATGGRIDVDHDPWCQELARHRPTVVADGLPVLEPDLCWPGTRIHLVGFAAALVLGPTAGNLIGHRRAAQRIVGRLRGLDPTQADRIVTGGGACPAQLGRVRR